MPERMPEELARRIRLQGAEPAQAIGAQEAAGALPTPGADTPGAAGLAFAEKGDLLVEYDPDED